MHFWHSFILITSWLIVLTVCGRRIAELLPPRARSGALQYLSPAIGLSLFVLIATGFSWLVGTQTWLALMVTTLLMAVALNRERNWPQLIRQLGWMVCTGVIISLGPLMTVWRYSGFNVFNDAFSYIAHAQWLQEHAFRENANPTVFQPAYTQIFVWQHHGFRMGGSFFLAWVQAVSPFKLSIYVYPAVISIALAVGAQAIGGLTAALFPTRSRRLMYLWSLVVGTSLSGFTFGSYAGFLAQLFALALGTALFAMLASFGPPANSRRAGWSESLPLAMLFTAAGFAYSELLPFMSFALLGWFVVRLCRDKYRRNMLVVAGCFLCWSLLLFNLECFRIIRALLVQSKVVVGWPVPWSLAEYATHVLGLHSGVGDGDSWLIPPMLAKVVAISALCFLACFAFLSCRRSARGLLRWSAPLAYLGICGMAFLIFRYFAHSPWPVGTGQSWSQFKLANWVSPVMFALLGVPLLYFAKRRLGALLIGLLMVVWVAANLKLHFQMAPERMAGTFQQTGKTDDPFSVFETLRAEALTAEPKGPIFLDLSDSNMKSRELASYFLHDFPIAADWTGDWYISPWLPPEWKSLSPTDCLWLVSRNKHIPGDGIRSSNPSQFVLSPVTEFQSTRRSLTGGYGEETDGSGWWIWSPDQLNAGLKVYGHLPEKVRLKFACIIAAEPRELKIIIRTKTAVCLSETVSFPAMWQSYTSPPFQLNDPDVEVQILSHSKPVPIGGADTRLVAFLIKNMYLDLAPSDP